VTVAVVSLLVVCVLGATSVLAATPAAGWGIHSFAVPSVFSTADSARCESTIGGGGFEEAACDAYQVTVTNTGSAASDGSGVRISDVLPAGVTLRRVKLVWPGLAALFGMGAGEDLFSVMQAFGACSTVPVECSSSVLPVPVPVAPDERIKLVVDLTLNAGTTGSLTNTASVSGGGAGSASTQGAANLAGSVPPVFGLSGFESLIAGLDGLADTRAGGHPYEFATRVDLNNMFRIGPQANFRATSPRDVRDVMIDLPVGFLGSVLAAPTCTFAQLSSHTSGGVSGCPTDTVVGHINTEPVTNDSVSGPVYNMVPEHGVPAEFGFIDAIAGAHVLYASVVPTPQGYVLRTTAPEIPQIDLRDVIATFYGNPAAKDAAGTTPSAFFTNPASCTGEPLVTSIHMDSWQSPGRYNADGSPDFTDPSWVASTSLSPPVTGCDLLHFDPSLSVRPETAVADSPTGLDVGVDVPQSEEPEGLATPPLRDASVTLPAGLAVNPSAAAGLGACSPAQIALGSAAPPSCPAASKVGTVELTTPAVAGTLRGSIYLATQGDNPFHALLAGYLVIDDPVTGVVVKVPGNLTPDPGTGQITGVFNDSPQFPFSSLKLHFFGGVHGELATPQACGSYTTTSDLMPWSAPDSGPDATPSDSFPIDTGCVSAFNPGFTAGTTSNQAGGFSPFTASFSRSDGDQNLSGVTVRTPPGLLGIINGVERCPEPQASQGTCGAGSLVGHTTATVGVGSDPFYVQGGQVFLTGPYKGAPFGFSIVVPAVAGPFNLGNVVVRAAINVDPHTAQITVTSDPLPRILQGIPLDIRSVNVSIDRAGFTFNPTNCEPLTVGGTLTSTQGTQANVSSRFQAANCANLPFKPAFTVSTQAKTSKKNGASLTVRVGYPKGAQANIRSVAVTLPKALPSRLTTIQQACPAAAFNANPASCPAGSDIGIATAHTPVLANPATGPAYLVSHGGAAFPDLVIVLQGEGITLDLVGSINIKKQVTSSAFNTVPDAPISSFELKLPEGPHSGLTAVLPPKAKGNLCGTTLTMPTTITGQNGAVIKQNTKIAVTGCPKAKKKAKAKKHHKKPSSPRH
jgi:hypothetical protein